MATENQYVQPPLPGFEDELSPIGDLTTSAGLAAMLTVSGIGDKRAIAFAKRFGSLERLKRACVSSPELFSEEQISQILPLQLPEIAKGQSRTISYFDEEYPDELKNISNPPALIWARGALPSSREKTLAVVGTRQPSAVAQRATVALVRQAVALGFDVISGFALGIDDLAHSSAVDSQARTIAVLGISIQDALSGNRAQLAREILSQGGCLISIVRDGDQANNGTFVRRNELIVAFTKKVLVIECGLDSGTMHTVRFALKLGRKLLVVSDPKITADGNKALLDQSRFAREILPAKVKVQLLESGIRINLPVPVSSPSELEQVLME